MKKNKLSLTVLVLLASWHIQAQKGTSASGGEATGVGGTVSYTVGQIDYSTSSGTNGSTTQGVQQPYEIFSIGIAESVLDIELFVYPNPTANNLTLKMYGFNDENLEYRLLDSQGKLIETKIISSNSTNISLEEQPTADYFLSIVNNNHIVKTFKIIKH